MKTYLVLGLALLTTTALWSAETYSIDPVHSTAIYKVKHFGVSNVYGRFDDVTGTVLFDSADPAKSSVEVTIKTESLDTANPKRDAHVKGPDFLNAKQFPVMTFKSTAVKALDAGKYEITGDFTLHGVTKPLTVVWEKVGEGKGPMGDYRQGGETTFSIKRSDFGMTGMMGPVGDDVQITVSVEGVRQS